MNAEKSKVFEQIRKHGIQYLRPTVLEIMEKVPYRNIVAIAAIIKERRLNTGGRVSMEELNIKYKTVLHWGNEIGKEFQNQCPYCSYRNKSYEQLQLHAREVHGTSFGLAHSFSWAFPVPIYW